METSNSSISLSEKLISGEEVKCVDCKKGIYKPFNSKVKANANHCFVCDTCGSYVMIEPCVVVE